MATRYQTSKIYRLLCKDGHYYIGSTTQALNVRLNTHKTLSKSKNDPIYKHGNQIGWDKIKIELLEEYPCTSKGELNEKEKEYRSLSKSDPLCLNDSSDIITVDPTNHTIYRTGKIYRLICNDGEYYIGSTVSNLSSCIANHKQRSISHPTESPYDHFIKIGWDNVHIELIVHYSCYSKEELDKQKEKIIAASLNDRLCLNHIDTNENDDVKDREEDVEKDVNESDEEDIKEDKDEESKEPEIIVNVHNKYKNGKIYKLSCNDGHYYYGSTTTSLEKRFICHKHAIKNNTHGGQYFYFSLIQIDDIMIELVENYQCHTKMELLQKENEYIIAHKSDPFCLNTYQSFQSEEDKKEYDKRYHEAHPDKAKEYNESHREEATQRTKEYRMKHKEDILRKESEYREAHRQLLCEKQKEYAKRNQDKVKETRKKTYEANKEKCAEYTSQYRKLNQEKIQAKQREWNQKKKEENAEQIMKEREEKRNRRKEQTEERLKKGQEIHLCECGGTYQLYRKNRHDNNKLHQAYLTSKIEPVVVKS